MIQIIANELWAVSALVNMMAGVGVTCMAIGVTDGWRFRTALDWIRSGHRASLGALALALFMSAGLTYDAEENPPLDDFAVQLAFLAAITFSGVRHRLIVRHQQRIAASTAAT